PACRRSAQLPQVPIAPGKHSGRLPVPGGKLSRRAPDRHIQESSQPLFRAAAGRRRRAELPAAAPRKLVLADERHRRRSPVIEAAARIRKSTRARVERSGVRGEMLPPTRANAPRPVNRWRPFATSSRARLRPGKIRDRRLRDDADRFYFSFVRRSAPAPRPATCPAAGL